MKSRARYDCRGFLEQKVLGYQNIGIMKGLGGASRTAARPACNVDTVKGFCGDESSEGKLKE